MTNTAVTAEAISDRITLARNYISDYWPDYVWDLGLQKALATPLSSFDDELDDYYAPIADLPLRNSLRLTGSMLEAGVAAYENIRRKIAAQYDDSLAPGANARFQDQWVAAGLRDAGIVWQGPFSGIATCQGGDEVDLIYGHPHHGLNRNTPAESSDLVSEDEYRRRTSPYVAAFGLEVYPGDLEAGLVHDRARHYLEASAAEK